MPGSLAGNEIREYVVPNTLTLPKLTPDLLRAGWLYGSETIYDIIKRDPGSKGHGTCMVVLAAGYLLGAAPRANIYLIKFTNEYWATSGPQIGWVQPRLELRAFEDAMQHIYDQVTTGGIPPHRSVVQVSHGRLGTTPILLIIKVLYVGYL